MRILLSSHCFWPSVGGIETMSLLLAREFARREHEVRVVTQTPLPAGQNEPDEGYAVSRRPGPRELLRLARWCDVCLHNNISLQTAWPVLLLRKPWVVAHHTWLTSSDGRVGRQERLKRFVLRFARQISISEAIAEHAPGESTIIENACREELFRILPGIERSGDLVFLGRLVSDKGADVALRALRLLGDRGVCARMTVVGEGEERGGLVALAAELGVSDRVAFVGAQTGEELVRTLNAHRVLVIPSRWREPFGLVALEGIACGCVPVGSEGGGLAEAIGPCGPTFPNGDANALADRLQELLSDPSRIESYRSAAPVHLERHAVAHVVSQYERELEAARR